MKDSVPKQLSWIVISLVVIGISFGVGFSSGQRSKPDIDKVTALINKESGKPEQVNFGTFWKTWNVLNEKYAAFATSTSDQDKVWGAIEGLAASLKDPYTVFFPPENNKIFESEIAGNFEGIGMQIGTKDEIITVIAPLKNTPAEKAGIMPGDKILRIDDIITAGMKEE